MYLEFGFIDDPKRDKNPLLIREVLCAECDHLTTRNENQLLVNRPTPPVGWIADWLPQPRGPIQRDPVLSRLRGGRRETKR